MARSLNEIRIDFSKILILEEELSDEVKAKKYAALMTELEKDYNVPLMQDDTFELNNHELMKLYKLISTARTYLWEDTP